jgi:hypothetical protein
MSELFGAPDSFPAESKLLFFAEEEGRAIHDGEAP